VQNFINEVLDFLRKEKLVVFWTHQDFCDTTHFNEALHGGWNSCFCLLVSLNLVQIIRILKFSVIF